ncbi:MAG TPA: metallophosphoesterase family protein [Gemmataceae bacterium]|jgi:serine/threonine protein phosphatase 1
MRLLAIGDIHGCLRALTTLLDLVAPRSKDRIITLGDYVDRGPDSRGVLDHLIALHDTGRLVALRGNHDVMMLEARKGHDLGWLAVGGKQALRSYDIADSKIDRLLEGAGWFGDPEELLAKIPERHWKFLEDDCLPYYETDEHIFVHANLYADLPLEEQPDYMLYWERLNEPCEHISGKTMICGHTRQKSGWPLNLGTTICIDTNVYEDGWLTCLNVHTGRIWQANERGETRTGWLDD